MSPVVTIGYTCCALFLGVGSIACAQTDMADPWNPNMPLPQFMTHNLIDPANLEAISKYGSDAGPPYVDDYAPFYGQVEKNYYQPWPQFIGNNNTLPMYAPADGVINSITPDGDNLPDGEPRGYQVFITADAYPMFGFCIFHVNVDPSLAAGTHVNSGDFLGYADIRNNAVAVDMAVVVWWGEKEIYQYLDIGQPLTDPGQHYVSAFDVMTDACVATYAPYGLTDRSGMIVPLSYREAVGVYGGGNVQEGLDSNEYFNFPPILEQQPSNLYAEAGGYAQTSFSVAYGLGPMTYQWYRNGVLVGAVTDNPAFAISEAVSTSDQGIYWCVATCPSGSIESAPCVVAVDPGNDGESSRLVDLSTLGLVSSSVPLTAGFVIGGPASKSLLIRAAGPALAQFAVGGFLPDPALNLIASSSVTLFSNQKWLATPALTAAVNSTGAFPFPSGSPDAALLAPLPGNASYSAQVTPGRPSDSGVVLAEVYDADPLSAPSQLMDISSLGFTGPGRQTLSAGFVIGGTAPKNVLIRAVGPSLAPFGVPGVISDPQLALFSPYSSQALATNRDWSAGGTDTSLASVFAVVDAFPLAVGSKDAAILMLLPPGSYSVQATSASGAAGVVLVEVYDASAAPPSIAIGTGFTGFE